MKTDAREEALLKIREEYGCDAEHAMRTFLEMIGKDFYIWLASKYPVYGAVIENLEMIDVGKMDALEPAEEFVKRNS